MSSDPTLPQGAPERRQSREKSLQGSQPPTQVPGYEPERILGAGAFGEVWVAKEGNTGRRVAIKFYAHRGGLDWSLLAREVEKLAFLFADRHVVQLLGVGWDADPPYYVMEYLEEGSLADRLQAGPLTVAQAVELFRDVAIGLVHAHGKGVLHCDLKPGNILLDQDHKPRLADFGQSRLSHEQVPALGTLFYMAPEQADMTAVPDARWDVYALGALLYCMLTGGAPHRGEEDVSRLERATDLKERLALYRKMIRRGPPPSGHRQIPGVDRALAEIVDRCLEANPRNRYANVQAVLDALDARATRRARRPTVLLGTFGPTLVLLVVSLFAWQGFSRAVHDSDQALIEQALKANQFAARHVTLTVKGEVERRVSVVEQTIGLAQLEDQLRETVEDDEIKALLGELVNFDRPQEEMDVLRDTFRNHPTRRRLQQAFESLIPPEWYPGRPETGNKVNSWYLNHSNGIQLVRVPEKPDGETISHTIGENYAWRTYFHGRPKDVEDETWRPPPGEHIDRTGPSAAYQSRATGLWNVAVSTPILAGPQGEEFLGVGGLTVGVGRLVDFPGSDERAAVLVERPHVDIPGHVLDHPLFAEMQGSNGRLPDAFKDVLVTVDDLPDTSWRKSHYRDPVSAVGRAYDKRWLAEMAPVAVNGDDTDWTVIVQESYESAIGSTLGKLKSGLIAYGLVALVMVALVVLGLWGIALRLLDRDMPTRRPIPGMPGGETPSSGTTPNGPQETD
jgi:hypothetical protein